MKEDILKIIEDNKKLREKVIQLRETLEKQGLLNLDDINYIVRKKEIEK